MTRRVSVVLPCRNEARYIAACLESILATAYPRDQLEILVVDGMSSDSTRRIVQEVACVPAKRDLPSPHGQPGEITLCICPRLKEFGWRGDVPGTEHEHRAAAETPGCPRLGGA